MIRKPTQVTHNRFPNAVAKTKQLKVCFRVPLQEILTLPPQLLFVLPVCMPAKECCWLILSLERIAMPYILNKRREKAHAAVTAERIYVMEARGVPDRCHSRELDPARCWKAASAQTHGQQHRLGRQFVPGGLGPISIPCSAAIHPTGKPTAHVVVR